LTLGQRATRPMMFFLPAEQARPGGVAQTRSISTQAFRRRSGCSSRPRPRRARRVASGRRAGYWVSGFSSSNPSGTPSSLHKAVAVRFLEMRAVGLPAPPMGALPSRPRPAAHHPRARHCPARDLHPPAHWYRLVQVFSARMAKRRIDRPLIQRERHHTTQHDTTLRGVGLAFDSRRLHQFSSTISDCCAWSVQRTRVRIEWALW
jgi:hypothetical protein